MSDNQLIDKYNKIRFKNFVFDFKTQSLSGHADDKDLPPKPSEILSLLLNRPGKLVTREQIIEAVWADQVVDFDQNINFCIKQIRQVLDDDPRAAKFIETVPKKGYRFIADYQPFDKKGTSKKLVWVVAALAVSLLTPVVIWQLYEPPQLDDKHYFSSSEAEQAITRGFYLLDQGGHENYQRAQRLFEKAISLEPQLADAHAGVALIRLFQVSDIEGRNAVKSQVTKAMRLNPDSAQANLAQAKISLYYDWDIVAARKYFSRASELAPNSIPALHDLAVVATIQGDFDVAEASIEKALDIDPGRFQEHYHAGWFYQVAGKYDMALRQCVQSLEIEPDYHFSLLCAGRSALKLELTQTAKHYLNEFMLLFDIPVATVERVLAEVEKGNPDAFNQWYIDLLIDYQSDPFKLALAYGEIGESEKALNALQNAIEQKNPMVPTAWAFDELKLLRDNERFVEMMAVVNRG
jgi:DNA-binding winged helix-turn-helix (wHTH) protein/tetratricopeptide (TPR) repeat protein